MVNSPITNYRKRWFSTALGYSVRMKQAYTTDYTYWFPTLRLHPKRAKCCPKCYRKIFKKRQSYLSLIHELSERRSGSGMFSFKNLIRSGMVAHACNPSTLGGRGRWITRSRDWDHLGQHGETPSLLKIQKLAGHGSVHLWSQLLESLRWEDHLSQEAEHAVSRDCHCTPPWATEWDPVSKNKK